MGIWAYIIILSKNCKGISINPLIVTDEYSCQPLLLEFLLVTSSLALAPTYFAEWNSTRTIAISAVLVKNDLQIAENYDSTLSNPEPVLEK